jgi:hypothetical protein
MTHGRFLSCVATIGIASHVGTGEPGGLGLMAISLRTLRWIASSSEGLLATVIVTTLL